MILNKLTILNYKNIREATLELSPKINCFIGRNGMGKTNVLDAVYYLSFCRSAYNPIDAQVIRHDEPFCMIEGEYSTENSELRTERCDYSQDERLDYSQDERLEVRDERYDYSQGVQANHISHLSPLTSHLETSHLETSHLETSHLETSHLSPLTSQLSVSAGMKRGQKKHFKRNKKEYKRLSEHIGLIPLVLVAPSDTILIEGSSEERRRLMDMVISQYDRSYIEALARYNNALQQRNTLLKQESASGFTPDETAYDPTLMELWEEQMAEAGEQIYRRRSAFVEELTPLFQQYYRRISEGHEQVGLEYISHCQRGPLLEVIRRDRMKDRAVGYSLHGVHRDDLAFTLGGHAMRREGSQGQHKTYVISLKLAQFEFLKRTASHTTPLLLLDDIFDKLDAQRVEQIVRLVSDDDFGQIFITDTNRDHLDQILSASQQDYSIFEVDEGEITPMAATESQHTRKVSNSK